MNALTKGVIGAYMFIRFAGGEVDPDARVCAGLFSALDEIYRSDEVPKYELEALKELENWFDEQCKCNYRVLIYFPARAGKGHCITT